jgi:hypothetical protein
MMDVEAELLQTQTQTQQEDDIGDVDARVKKIESYFSLRKTEAGNARKAKQEFSCTLCAARGVLKLVQCHRANGASGRLSHLKCNHEDEFKQLPAAKGKRSREVSSGSSDRTIAESFARTDVVDFVCRQLLPHTVFEDPLFRSLKMNRKTGSDAIRERSDDLLQAFLCGVNGNNVAVCVDLGTTNGHRTLDISVVCGGSSQPFLIAAAPKGEARATDIVASCREVKARLDLVGARVIAWVSDNALNVRNAMDVLAESCGGVSVPCMCHVVQLMLVHSANNERTAAVSQICDKARQCDGPVRVPIELAARWFGLYNAATSILKHVDGFVLADGVTTDDVKCLKDYVTAHEPFVVAGRSVEGNSCTAFTAARALSILLQTVERPPEDVEPPPPAWFSMSSLLRVFAEFANDDHLWAAVYVSPRRDRPASLRRGRSDEVEH